MTGGAPRAVPDGLDTVLQLVREHGTTTRPEIARSLGLGRNLVTQRVTHLMHAGLVKEGDLASSTGGRAPRGLQFDAGAGHVLAAEVGATSITAAVTDLSAGIIAQHEEPADVTAGPEPVLKRVAALFGQLQTSVGGADGAWGVGIGVPGPVEFASGRPIAPPIMPGWDGFAVREFLAERYDAPVWVDNDVNVMALGEHRVGPARGFKTFCTSRWERGSARALFRPGICTGGRRDAPATSVTSASRRTGTWSVAAARSDVWRRWPEERRWRAKAQSPRRRAVARTSRSCWRPGEGSTRQR